MKVSTDACLFGAWINVLLSDTSALDIGGGSGLLSCMVAQKQKNIFIDAIEIDGQASQQASDNIADSPFAAQIKVHHKALQDYKSELKYDLIFSNPPYYEQDLLSPNNAVNLAKHSSQLSLYDLFFYAQKMLSIKGRICLVLPSKRFEQLSELVTQYKMYIAHLTEVKHTPSKKCNLILIEIHQQEAFLFKDEIFIKDELGQDDIKFKKLLQNYYLNF
jgi:tRNA1Val (adenine37-N6)-methyltransferase